jgi:hypothetical protein
VCLDIILVNIYASIHKFRRFSLARKYHKADSRFVVTRNIELEIKVSTVVFGSPRMF